VKYAETNHHHHQQIRLACQSLGQAHQTRWILSLPSVGQQGRTPMLAAGLGSEVEMETDGEQEAEAMQALVALFTDKFGEGE
jgi:hypothetical protein